MSSSEEQDRDIPLKRGGSKGTESDSLTPRSRRNIRSPNSAKVSPESIDYNSKMKSETLILCR
jgi:hypothetical protein